MALVNLKPADRVEITILMDNYTDLFLLESRGVMHRPTMPRGRTPLAEHGLAVLIEATVGETRRRILLDAGLTPNALLNNLSVFGVDSRTVDGVVLSHGHLDHFGGLMGFLGKASPGLPLVCHPDAFLPRRLNIPGRGPQPEMPVLQENALREGGVRVHMSAESATWFDDLILATGEVERVTDFETGFLWAEIKQGGSWSIDPFYDDQGLVVRVKDQGLVVVGGCSHAGIINTVLHARKVTGIDTVLAVLGGFHLTGPMFEPLIEPTIQEMKRLDPAHVVPLHCTGWRAINRFAQEMPGRFHLNTVGTRYVFE